MVAVLDTGTRTVNVDYDVSAVKSLIHRRTSSRQWNNPHDDGYFYIPGPTEVGLHGNSISQIVGSRITGVGKAPSTAIIHGVIADYLGYTTDSNMWKGLEWANNHGAVAANISFEFGGLWLSTGTDAEVKALPHSVKSHITDRNIARQIITSGMAIVHAAGNSNSNLSTFISQDTTTQSSITHTDLRNNLIIVGALGGDLSTRASYSSYPGTDPLVQTRFIMAPGKNEIRGPVNERIILVGTSGAAAHISGAIATMKSRWQHLTGKQLAQIILNTADQTFIGYNLQQYGQGRADFVAAFSPIGTTSFKTINHQVIPLKAATVRLPTGFKPQVFKAAFLDQYGRDYQALFKTLEKPYQSNFHNQLYYSISPQKRPAIINLKQGKLSFSEKLTDHSSTHNIVGFSGFDSSMFADSRQLQKIKLHSGDINFEIGSNFTDQMKKSLDGINAKGVSAAIAYKNWQLSTFSAIENNSLAFYGAEKRYAKGGKLTYSIDLLNTGLLNIGAEYKTINYAGKNLFINNIQTATKTLSLGLDFIKSPSLAMGVMGKHQISNTEVSMMIPRSVGDGTLRHQKETLSSKQDSFAAGLYTQINHFNLSLYADQHDRNISLIYQRPFHN